MDEVPRPLEVAYRDGKNETPMGRQKIAPHKLAERVEPLMAMIASGEIPLDDHSAQVISTYLDNYYKRAQRGG